MLKKILAATSGLFGIPLRFPRGRHRGSKYAPHIGKKEQERAKRCRMVETHPNGTLRSSATMEQMSKREYEARKLVNAA